ncbi:hypothetical protein MON38_17495 [Hymenobacter sp. DH14]|uniref:Uncharacterized protein n=1 Tax=Hymenobacter cyanobacteriorum TaxID=2926463 RepID=A0A9X1VI38_9BACT|nr:hypothetical protein [Hymenobacter cyanobacteriorum]MCI1189222.1 hypothetical protein [Hymenobacter cyanobacteriorum]
MRFRTFLTYLSLLPLSACTKSCNEFDNNEEFAHAKLPAYTETGANTLGCVLGPQTWTVLGKYNSGLNYGGRWQPNGLEAYAGSYSGILQLRAGGRMTGVRNSKEFYDAEIGLTFQLTDTLGGLRLLADTSRVPGKAEFMVATNFIEGIDFKSSARHPVRLFVRKLDRQQRIVSGTFSGMLYQTNGPDSLAVTDGRFDLRY